MSKKNDWVEDNGADSRSKHTNNGILFQGSLEREANRRNHGSDREYPHYTYPNNGKEAHYSVNGKQYALDEDGKPDYSKGLNEDGSVKDPKTWSLW